MLNKHVSDLNQFTEKYFTSFSSTFSGLQNKPSEELQSLYEIMYPLQDDLLTKVDRATMQHSIEARVPLLDNHLVQLALQIDSSLKIKNGINKYPLKKLLANYVPEEIFMRPKRGFSIPLAKWLKTEWKYLIDDYLNEKVIAEVGLFKPEEVKKMIRQFYSGDDYLYNRLWCLIALHRWLIKKSIIRFAQYLWF